MKSLSIIIPCFNEEEVIEKTYQELKTTLVILNRPYEIIFVDDGSHDKTYNIIKTLANEDPFVGGISLSRNFGKEGVIEAGLKQSKGDMVALMDADLQDPPSLLVDMIRLIEEEGYDQVGTYRINRKSQSLLTRLFSEGYYRTFNLISGNAKVVNNEREYRLMTRKVVDILLQCHEQGRYIKNLWSWVGFKTTHIGYEDIDRAAGQTKYNITKKLKLAKKNILVSSIEPLKWLSSFSVFFLVMTVIITFEELVFNMLALEWGVLLTLWLSALMFVFLGLMSEYLAIVVFEVKNRPNFIIQDQFESKLK